MLDENFWRSIGLIVRNVRRLKKLSQSDLAARAGLSRLTIVHIEWRWPLHCGMLLGSLLRIALVFEMPAWVLLTVVESPQALQTPGMVWPEFRGAHVV